MTGLHAVLILRPYDIPSVAHTPGVDVRGVVPTPYTKALQAPRPTNKAIGACLPPLRTLA